MTIGILNQRDSGCSLELKDGDVVTIRLPENPTTGFRWQVNCLEADIHLTGDSFESNKETEIGSGGVREFRFRFHGPKGGAVTLKHWRAWEGEASIIEQFDFKVEPMS